MIKYNKLKIEGSNIIIDLLIEDYGYYAGISITGIRVDSPLTYGKDWKYALAYKSVNNLKSVNTTLSIAGGSKELLIVTPIVLNVDYSIIPCGRETPEKGVVYDKNILLNKGLNYLNDLGDSCTKPKGFIDYILKTKALDLSISTCNYEKAIQYWDMIKNSYRAATPKSCGCHGPN